MKILLMVFIILINTNGKEITIKDFNNINFFKEYNGR